jgi:hypothetical protein
VYLKPDGSLVLIDNDQVCYCWCVQC